MSNTLKLVNLSISGTLGIKLGAAGSGSQCANHCAMLAPISQNFTRVDSPEAKRNGVSGVSFLHGVVMELAPGCDALQLQEDVLRDPALQRLLLHLREILRQILLPELLRVLKS